MFRKDLFFVLKSFLIWRLFLFICLFLSSYFFDLQANFLGGGMANYLKAPWLWAWANFDGEHYLAIAQRGYGSGEEAFFPLYPFLIKLLGGGIWAGLFISHLAFFLALIGFYQLVKIDFKEKIARLTLILFLLFPTSFYFGSVYTESLFLALVVWSFYLARRQKWLGASLLGMFASATRLIGILLLPVLAIRKKSFWLLLIPLGLAAYLGFLKQTTGDPFKFLHVLPGFGEQRSATPILLPQVFYRYLFKILPNLNYQYFPVVFATWLEFGVALFFLFLIFYLFVKLEFDYWLFMTLGYLIPTLSGSFSSLPRYVLVLFPAFIYLAVWLERRQGLVKFFVFALLLAGLAISTALFGRGFWLA